MKPSTRSAPTRDREAARRRRNSLGRDDKVRRIEDDVKNKRSVFTTVWNWTASPREKWGSPTMPGKWYCVLRGYIARTTGQRGGGGCGGLPLAWIYSAQDAAATWYLLSPGRLPTNASVIKPRECSRYCALCSQRHLPCTRRCVREISSYRLLRLLSSAISSGKMKCAFVARVMLFNLPKRTSSRIRRGGQILIIE